MERSGEDPDKGRVLVVDDDAAVCWALNQALTAEGYAVEVAADAAAALRSVRRHRPDLVLTDVRMPGESGLELLSALTASHPNLPVIVMTAHGTMETAIEAVQGKAFDYLPKPIDLDRLAETVRRAMGEQVLAVASTQLAGFDTGQVLIGSTPVMQEVYRRVAAASATDLGVLISGPSGSGKELVARALHRHSCRADGPFIAVNCGALPDNLVESELFGHEAGAFTDAKQRKIGRVEAADKGTLFLDEVSELPPASQVKLLRFLEDQRFLRLGGEEEIRVDIRIMAATNRDLSAQIERGAFREDLGYRLQVVTIRMPALDERLDDVPALARHFLNRVANRLGRSLALTDEAMQLLLRYSWPGNVRELRHVIEEGAVLATGGIIDCEHLRIAPAIPAGPGLSGLAAALRKEIQRLMHQAPGSVHARLIDLVEEHLLADVLARTRGNQLKAAEILGINRITLKKRMDQLGVCCKRRAEDAPDDTVDPAGSVP